MFEGFFSPLHTLCNDVPIFQVGGLAKEFIGEPPAAAHAPVLSFLLIPEIPFDVVQFLDGDLGG